MKYSVVIHKDLDSDYGVTVPDLLGCFSAGDTVEEALEMSKEAIECHLEGMLLDNETIPKVQPIEIHQANPDYAGGIWGIVEVDIFALSPKSKQVEISLPEYLLNSIDDYVEQHGENRSVLVANAVTEYMGNH